MSATKHLALEKFESVDMPLRGAVTPRQAEGCANSGRVSTNAEDLAAQFGHMRGFGSLKPPLQCLHQPFFEQGDKLLAKAGRPPVAPR
jgi:hypothetical protein